MAGRQVRGGAPARTTVLWGLLTLALGVSLALALVLRGGDSTDDASQADALAAARAAAIDLTTYDHSSLDRDFSWVDRGGTTSFAREYVAANKPLRAIILKLEARSAGSVVDAAVTLQDRTHADVLMFVDQVITNGSDDTRRTERNRVLMSMVDQDGRWLVDEVRLR